MVAGGGLAQLLLLVAGFARLFLEVAGTQFALQDVCARYGDAAQPFEQALPVQPGLFAQLRLLQALVGRAAQAACLVVVLCGLRGLALRQLDEGCLVGGALQPDCRHESSLLASAIEGFHARVLELQGLLR